MDRSLPEFTLGSSLILKKELTLLEFWVLSPLQIFFFSSKYWNTYLEFLRRYLFFCALRLLISLLRVAILSFKSKTSSIFFELVCASCSRNLSRELMRAGILNRSISANSSNISVCFSSIVLDGVFLEARDVVVFEWSLLLFVFSVVFIGSVICMI